MRCRLLCAALSLLLLFPTLPLQAQLSGASGNVEATILASLARTATTDSNTLLNSRSHGVMLNVPIPRQWRISVTHADTDSITYSVGASYID